MCFWCLNLIRDTFEGFIDEDVPVGLQDSGSSMFPRLVFVLVAVMPNLFEVQFLNRIQHRSRGEQPLCQIRDVASNLKLARHPLSSGEVPLAN